MHEVHEILHNLSLAIVNYGTQLIAAFIILLIGWWVAKLIRTSLNLFMEKRKVEATIRLFTCRLIYLSILTFVFIAALAKLGIETTSLIAIIGAIGIGIGLALKNSLADFAAGILLIIFRPFKVGDTIDTNGMTGTVEEINLLLTQLKTSDGRALLVPNGKLMGNNIINFSTYSSRRNDITIGISYDSDLLTAKNILNEIVNCDQRILTQPKALISVNRLTDSSVQLLVRYWTASSDFDATAYAVNEAIKLRFEQARITIPTSAQQIIVNNK